MTITAEQQSRNAKCIKPLYCKHRPSLGHDSVKKWFLPQNRRRVDYMYKNSINLFGEYTITPLWQTGLFWACCWLSHLSRCLWALGEASPEVYYLATTSHGTSHTCWAPDVLPLFFRVLACREIPQGFPITAERESSKEYLPIYTLSSVQCNVQCEVVLVVLCISWE